MGAVVELIVEKFHIKQMKEIDRISHKIMRSLENIEQVITSEITKICFKEKNDDNVFRNEIF